MQAQCGCSTLCHREESPNSVSRRWARPCLQQAMALPEVLLDPELPKSVEPACYDLRMPLQRANQPMDEPLQVPGTLHRPFIPAAWLPHRRKGTAARLEGVQGRAHAAVVGINGCVGAQQQAVGVIAGRVLLHALRSLVLLCSHAERSVMLCGPPPEHTSQDQGFASTHDTRLVLLSQACGCPPGGYCCRDTLIMTTRRAVVTTDLAGAG